MLVISDSPTFYLSKAAKIKNIKIDSIINLSPECEKQIPIKTKSCIILLSESFYNFFEDLNEDLLNQNIKIKNIFLIINQVIEKLISIGAEIYLPLIPRHFFYCNPYQNIFIQNDSYALFIQSINHKLLENFSEKNNIIFLKGIEELKESISKTYFRFYSIYDQENIYKIFDQIEQYKKFTYQKSKKLIILDLDNTLWKGIIGEDGLNGITIDSSDPVGRVYRSVQNLFLKLKNKGFILAICSKNEEKLALKALFKSKASIFREVDIVTHRINWQLKSENIKDICKELNISLLETVFVDDNAYECDEVLNNCKGISIFKVPKDIYKYPIAISKSDLFHINKISKEDKMRSDFYRDKIKREKILKDYKKEKLTKKSWIKSLDMELNINPIGEDNSDLERIVQLFNRTNQFNLSGAKYNYHSFLETLQKHNNYFYSGSSLDRVGSEGLISVIGFKLNKKEIIIHSYILSCRVFGKYIEESMLMPILNIALKNKYTIKFEFIENQRNLVIKNFLKEILKDKLYLSHNEITYLLNKINKFPISISNNFEV